MIKIGLRFKYKFQQGIKEVYEVVEVDEAPYLAQNTIRPKVYQLFSEKQILDNLA